MIRQGKIDTVVYYSLINLLPLTSIFPCLIIGTHMSDWLVFSWRTLPIIDPADQPNIGQHFPTIYYKLVEYRDSSQNLSTREITLWLSLLWMLLMGPDTIAMIKMSPKTQRKNLYYRVENQSTNFTTNEKFRINVSLTEFSDAKIWRGNLRWMNTLKVDIIWS